ncbi:Dolichyl pyrophosphate Glc1Man9GlcNAc2 alpha-1,3-glucosyltransferase [Verticillium dahliae VDG2]|nr:Dolichyl pyrophosphate Glc1Man9GlcNAc2 alpha-1,3-glucosyltransferase [Verticillium dahliae VDG2]
MSNKTPQPTASGHTSGAQPKQLSLATRAIHSDDHISAHRAIAPAMHVSTTFEYSRNPDDLKHWDNTDPAAPLDSHIYSRATAPNTTRLEAILSSALNGPSMTYASGLAAFHALLVRLNPRRIAIGPCYHGCLGILRPGDVIHVETPLNPTGEALDLPGARDPDSWLRKQMPGGFGPVFAFYMKDKSHARRLPSKLGLFHHATSLGGVESIIEWRRVSDGECDERLLRVSIGVEGWEDLRDDLVEGFAALIKEDETPLDDLRGSLVI